MAKKQAQELPPSGFKALDEERASRQAEGQPRIAYEPLYAKLAGDAVAGLVLAQIIYWFSPDKDGNSRIRVRKDGKGWIAKSYAEWAYETGVSEKQAARSIKDLVKLGIVEERNALFAGKHMKHVRLLEEGLERRIHALQPAREGEPTAAEAASVELPTENLLELVRHPEMVVSEVPQRDVSEEALRAASITESTQRARDIENSNRATGSQAPSRERRERQLPDGGRAKRSLGVLARIFGHSRFGDALEHDYDEALEAESWMLTVLEAEEFGHVKRDFEAALARGLDFREALVEQGVLEEL